MASPRYEKKYGNDPSVVVNHRNGCGLCGRKGVHTHRQPDWQEFVDRVGNPVTRKR